MADNRPSGSSSTRDYAHPTAAWWYAMARDKAGWVQSWSRANTRFWERTAKSMERLAHDAGSTVERAAADMQHDMERNEQEAEADRNRPGDEARRGDIASEAMRQSSRVAYDVSVSMERTMADVMSAWADYWRDMYDEDRERSGRHPGAGAEPAGEAPSRPAPDERGGAEPGGKAKT